MPTWRKLYALIWLNFASIMVVNVRMIPFHTFVHGALGLCVLALALHNRMTLDKLDCPDRIKRIAAATVMVGGAACVLGVVMMVGVPEWLLSWLGGFHLTFALAGFAQSASLASIHDVWLTQEVTRKAAATA